MIKPDKITERDKNLLAALFAAALAAFLILFVILPAVRKRDGAEEELAASVERRGRVFQQAAAIQDLSAQAEALSAELETARASFSRFHGAETIDADFTGKALELGLTPESMRIEPMSEPNSNLPAEQETDEADTELVYYAVSFEASGELKELTAMADYISSVYGYALNRLEITGLSPARAAFAVTAAFLK